MSADGPRIIVKRHAHAEHDEHGGQWKVAYADFVTALMAFFLIMWLLSSTTDAQRAGIAKYFSSSSLTANAGGGILDGGRGVLDGGGASQSDAETSAAASSPQAQQDEDRTERQRFESVKAEVERMMQGGALQETAGNLRLELTAEGLRISIFDRDGSAMFAPGTAEPTPRLAQILGIIAQVIAPLPNAVTITGHTDAQALRRGGYSNWELSADRANAARRALVADGLPPGRMQRIEGRAATDPLVPDAPADPRNRRIAITLLRRAAAAAAQRPASP